MPEYKISASFILDYKKFLWCHTKNVGALNELRSLPVNFFWHTDENYVLTSQNFIWVYPGVTLLKKSIAVLPETVTYSKESLYDCFGICSDNILKYEKLFKFD